MINQAIKRSRPYDQVTLLNDHSMNWKGFDREALLASARRESETAPITRLRHPEVRYEVTDHCNAECIMCPRDMHKLGRPHGIMDRQDYEKKH